MNRFLLQLTIVLACAAGVSSTSAAQIGAPSPAYASTGPTITSATLGVRTIAADPVQNARVSMGFFATDSQRKGVGRPRALMILGGAAVAAGIIAGGDVGTLLILSGAGVGGYGLYLHMNGRR